MRKLLATCVVAAPGIALLAAPASALFEHRFRVFEKASLNPTRRDRVSVPGKASIHGIATTVLVVPAVAARSAKRWKCWGTYHLDGEIGGFGDVARITGATFR